MDLLLRIPAIVFGITVLSGCDGSGLDEPVQGPVQGPQFTRTIDFADVDNVYATVDRGNRLDSRSLPQSGVATYDGYVTINSLRPGENAVGVLATTVDFGTNRYSQTTGDFAIRSNVIGSLVGGGDVVRLGGSALRGTLRGTVDGIAVDLQTFGRFVGSGDGFPNAVRGGFSDGSSHSGGWVGQ